MYITDIDGKRIEVTNLRQAIVEAKRYTRYRHRDQQFAAMDERLHRYWTDVLQKLQDLSNDKTEDV